jgi:hypothetical protein
MKLNQLIAELIEISQKEDDAGVMIEDHDGYFLEVKSTRVLKGNHSTIVIISTVE